MNIAGRAVSGHRAGGSGVGHKHYSHCLTGSARGNVGLHRNSRGTINREDAGGNIEVDFAVGCH